MPRLDPQVVIQATALANLHGRQALFKALNQGGPKDSTQLKSISTILEAVASTAGKRMPTYGPNSKPPAAV